MAFDRKVYLSTVYRPFSKDRAALDAVRTATRELHEVASRSALSRAESERACLSLLGRIDLAQLLDIGTGDSREANLGRIRSVESVLNKTATAPPSVGLLGLLKAIREAGLDLGDPEFWSRFTTARREAQRPLLEAFGEALKEERGALGVITPEEVRRLAQANGIPAQTSDRELAAVARSASVVVCPDFEAPSGTALDAGGIKDIDPSFASIVDVILLADHDSRGQEAFTVIDAFARNDKRVTRDDVARSKQRSGMRGSDAYQSAAKNLTWLLGNCGDDTQLHDVVLAWFIDFASDLVNRKGVLTRPAIERLRSTGLQELDARRIVAKVRADRSGPSLPDVTDRLVEGHLGEARAMFDALTGGTPQSEQASALAASLDKAERRKQALVDAYRRATSAKDFVAAETALREALAIDRDDTVLEHWMENIPPLPPAGVRAAGLPDGTVAISWRSAGPGDLTWTVVRAVGRSPANPRDGVVLAEQVSTERVVDPGPPVAQPVEYAVFASRPGGQLSDAANSSFLLLPAPADVAVDVGSDRATVSWATPDASRGVSVVLDGPRGPVRDLGTTQRRQVSVDGLELGIRYEFVLTAVYALPEGRIVNSEPVRVPATPRGRITPVRDLHVVERTLSDGTPGIRATWTDVPGFHVELWAMPLQVAVPDEGTVAPEWFAENGGNRVRGEVMEAGRTHTLVARQLADVRRIVPVTAGDGVALIGPSTVTGRVPAPQDMTVTRFGDELLVSWIWPHGDFLSRVVWSGRRSGSRSVTRSEFKASSGVRLSPADGITEVAVSMVAGEGGDVHSSEAASRRVDSPPRSVRYTVDIHRPLVGRHRADIVVGADGAGPGRVRLLVVMSAGTTMPASPHMGEVLSTLDVNLGAGEYRSSVDLQKLKGTIWLRLFCEEGSDVVVLDPAARTLKG